MRYLSAHKGRRRCRGSVIVEFALIIPILVLLFLGTIAYGYDFYTYNRLEEVVRAGARFASTQQYDAYTTSGVTCKRDCLITLPNSFAFAQRVKEYTVFGDPAATDAATPIVEGLTTNNITVTARFVDGYPVYVTVGVTGYVLRTPMGTITLQKPATTFAYVGNFVPTKP